MTQSRTSPKHQSGSSLALSLPHRMKSGAFPTSVRSRPSSTYLVPLCSLLLVFGLTGCLSPFQSEVPAPDATQAGLYETRADEYLLPPEMDPTITPERITQVHAQVIRPVPQAHLGPLPLVVLLHGNHATCENRADTGRAFSCEYTETGACGASKSPVPSYLGYSYFASRLASWGMIVVSIDANRGINCANSLDPTDAGLIWARARLVRKHLQLIQNNQFAPTIPSAAIDWQKIGLFGHSRGGEAMRALDSLIAQEAGDGLKIQGIFELGSTDRTRPRALDAPNVPWVGLLPLCDGDIYKLELQRVFDRAISRRNTGFKSLFAIQGANHNAYNSEWEASDSASCLNQELLDPETQRKTAIASILSFFRGIFGLPTRVDAPSSGAPTPDLLSLFHPSRRLPETWPSSRDQDPIAVQRAYLPPDPPGGARSIEDFQLPFPMSRSGQLHQVGPSSSLVAFTLSLPEHDPSHRALALQWTQSGSEQFIELALPQPPLENSGQAVSSPPLHHPKLSLRVSPFTQQLSNLDFSLQVRDRTGSWSPPTSIREWLSVEGPFGTPGHPHFILPTVIIDLEQLGVQSASDLRLQFDRTSSGSIVVSDLMITHDPHD